jgi:uncharacterized protein with PIN domain
MSRIRKAYEARFRALLQRARARRPEQGVRWMVAKAQRLGQSEGITLAAALTQVYESVAVKPYFKKSNSANAPIRFLCDAGLGGLARWLRAAGHEALWQPDIDDDELLRQARQIAATVLTTDSMLLERRVLRDRIIPSLWLPPTLKIPEQLALVFREFDLRVGEPRCMSCGGELLRADKETLRERIPPRTWRWLDEYFVCARCDKLFWRGTHWERISRTLKEAVTTAP